MSISGQSGIGRIRLFDDFCGPEIPVLNAVAYGITAGGCSYYLGPFTVRGDLAQTDAGVVSLLKASGYVRIGGDNQNGKGVFVGTEVVFSPVLNGTLVCECRLAMQSLTNRVVFVGFRAVVADDCLEPMTSTGTTITRICNAVGFLFDSQLTDADQWHMPYLLANTATQTSTNVGASQAAVATESDILRVEVDNNGAARWYINGKLEQSIGAGLAATTTTLLAGGVGCWGTAVAVADVDVDYLLIEANRDWTR